MSNQIGMGTAGSDAAVKLGEINRLQAHVERLQSKLKIVTERAEMLLVAHKHNSGAELPGDDEL